MECCFTLLAERYERGSSYVTNSNLGFRFNRLQNTGKDGKLTQKAWRFVMLLHRATVASLLEKKIFS